MSKFTAFNQLSIQARQTMYTGIIAYPVEELVVGQTVYISYGKALGFNQSISTFKEVKIAKLTPKRTKITLSTGEVLQKPAFYFYKTTPQLQQYIQEFDYRYALCKCLNKFNGDSIIPDKDKYESTARYFWDKVCCLDLSTVIQMLGQFNTCQQIYQSVVDMPKG